MKLDIRTSHEFEDALRDKIRHTKAPDNKVASRRDQMFEPWVNTRKTAQFKLPQQVTFLHAEGIEDPEVPTNTSTHEIPKPSEGESPQLENNPTVPIPKSNRIKDKR